MAQPSLAERAIARRGKLLRARGFVADGDRIVITVGAPMGAPGSTNSLQIFTVEQNDASAVA